MRATRNRLIVAAAIIILTGCGPSAEQRRQQHYDRIIATLDSELHHQLGQP